MRMATRTVKFEEVGFSASKSGICPVCGKIARRNKHFYQTLNPWNVNANGEPKNAGEIIPELRTQAKAWKEEPTYHAKCE